MRYPVCKLWLILADRYKTTSPFKKFSKEHSLEYHKVREYGANVFKYLDYGFVEKLCAVLNCEFDDLFIDDKEKYFERRSREKVGVKDNRIGVVYFIKNNEGLTKIGRTINLKKRLLGLKHEHRGKGLKVIHYIESQDVYVLEKTLHKVFADKRIQGEWFDLSDQDLSNIKK